MNTRAFKNKTYTLRASGWLWDNFSRGTLRHTSSDNYSNPQDVLKVWKRENEVHPAPQSRPFLPKQEFIPANVLCADNRRQNMEPTCFESHLWTPREHKREHTHEHTQTTRYILSKRGPPCSAVRYTIIQIPFDLSQIATAKALSATYPDFWSVISQVAVGEHFHRHSKRACHTFFSISTLQIFNNIWGEKIWQKKRVYRGTHFETEFYFLFLAAVNIPSRIWYLHAFRVYPNLLAYTSVCCTVAPTHQTKHLPQFLTFSKRVA